ncbi:MAG: hypothetical protein ABI451_08645 [Dokdonella sp.]
MVLAYEYQLMGLLIGLYVLDSSLLLYANEGLLICTRRKRWRTVFGNGQLMIFGRSLYIANLLTPHFPTFRLSWVFGAEQTESAPTQWSTRTDEYRSIAPPCIATASALFVLLPLGFFSPLGTPLVLAAIVLNYASIVTTLILLYRRRAVLNLSAKRCATLAFECLACPPFAVNLIRRITLAERIVEPLPDAGSRLLDAPSWGSMKQHCAERIVGALDAEPEDSSRLQSLNAHLNRFR